MSSSSSAVPLSPTSRHELDRLVEARDGVHLDGEVVLQLLDDGLTDVDLAEALHVRQALEEEDALDQLVGVLHLVDRLLADVLVEPLVAPVLAHLRVQEVLVDGGELAGEDLVQRGR